MLPARVALVTDLGLMAENQAMLGSLRSKQDVAASHRLIHLRDVRRERLFADGDEEEETPEIRLAA